MISSLLLTGLFGIILVWSGSGIGLALVAACIGLFIFAVGAIIQAAAMDVTPEWAGGTTISILSLSSALFTIPSPMIAGWLSDRYGTPSVFPFSGSLIILSALLLMFLHIDGKNAAADMENWQCK